MEGGSETELFLNDVLSVICCWGTQGTLKSDGNMIFSVDFEVGENTGRVVMFFILSDLVWDGWGERIPLYSNGSAAAVVELVLVLGIEVAAGVVLRLRTFHTGLMLVNLGSRKTKEYL